MHAMPPEISAMRLSNLRRFVAPFFLCVGLVFATGCAHDRHTGAVIGGIIGAGVGYVIASEHEHQRKSDYKKSRHAHDYSYPPPHGPARRDPYCP